VSRHHAQIRLRFGQYVIFDLGSQAGTMVNGKPIQQKALEPGDVISLAGVSLIYVEEDLPGEQPPISDTQPYPPSPHT
jgi:pSer/pThr/pTyr-binding forkhead associated (FHA) protein